jgi:diguanylate cyclase (GGDEF)-like protein
MIARNWILGPSGRVAGLATVVAGAAVVVYFTAVAGEARPSGIVELPWWALALLFCCAEAYPVHLQFRREAHSLSLSDVALVLGLFMTNPGGVVLAQIVGAGVAVLFVRRQRPLKIVFNLAQFALASSVAVALFHLILEQGSQYGFAGWLGSLSAAGASSLISAALVTAVVRLVGSKGSPQELAYVAAVAAIASFASASLGVAAVEVVRTDVRAVWVLAIPALACGVALHAYTRQRRRHQHLEFLYRSMRAMQGAPELHSAVRELLGAARMLLSAEFAEVVLLPMDKCEAILRGTVSATGEPALEPVALDESMKLALELAASNDGAILLPRGRERHPLDPYLASREIADAVLSIVRAEEGIGGMILVGEHAGDVETFTSEDAQLLETFANHAAVVLESGQVREQLRYQAFHDPLTGLPNRFLFADRVAEALAKHRGGSEATTVLFFDLDDFKTINDSLGHSAGDELLIAVAERLQACTHPGAVASRLGGDEFAILLSAATPAQAEAFTSRLHKAFNDFFALHNREIAIHPSIGIAIADGSATTAEELLRNADVAMYTAKSNGKRSHAFYEPDMHTRAQRRQELASALERGLERSEIRVHYQPIIELGSGAVFGFEALARWQHPDHGLLSAGSFIPLAEETGLTTGIGRVVLRSACEQLADWQRAFGGRTPLVMSVNLAPLELQNPHLVNELEAVLQASGLTADSLILEITEGMALRDPHATVERLHELRQLGVRIALDDFGTGYSSLSHLRELPIDLLKIAKPFVDSLSADDEPFIKAMIQIAEALELLVVAEGIEHPFQAKILHLLDCNLGQGYHYSKPLDPTSAERYLRIAAQQAWRHSRQHSHSHRHHAPAAISG